MVSFNWSKVDIRGWQECWPWLGQLNGSGYGPHRRAYEELVGPIPDGLELDHVEAWGCEIRHCVNPLHMEPVTHAENMRRGSKTNGNKTHCPAGHPYTEANTYLGGRGERNCRRCHNDRERARKAQLRAPA